MKLLESILRERVVKWTLKGSLGLLCVVFKRNMPLTWLHRDLADISFDNQRSQAILDQWSIIISLNLCKKRQIKVFSIKTWKKPGHVSYGLNSRPSYNKITWFQQQVYNVNWPSLWVWELMFWALALHLSETVVVVCIWSMTTIQSQCVKY